MAFVSNDSQQISLNDSTFNLTEREKRVLEKAYNEVMGTINQFVDIQNKYMSDDNKNKENIIDL